MEQFRPVRESLIRSDNRAGLLIAVGNEPEEQIAFLAIYGGVPNLIHDHQRGLVVTSPLARTSRFIILLELNLIGNSTGRGRYLVFYSQDSFLNNNGRSAIADRPTQFFYLSDRQ